MPANTGLTKPSCGEGDLEKEMDPLTKKYSLRLALAYIKELRKSYLRIQTLPADKEITKALEFYDRQEEAIIKKLLQTNCDS